MDELEATPLAPRLWQGPLPRKGEVVAQAGFDALVLCAYEFQHPPEEFPGVEVIHCPLVDELCPLSDQDAALAHATAEEIARRFMGGRKILVTCFAGLNRSGLVSALSVRLIAGTTGREARMVVQGKIEHALSNSTFSAFLDALPRPSKKDGSAYQKAARATRSRTAAR